MCTGMEAFGSLECRGSGMKARVERGHAADCRAAGGYCYGCP
jgi:hypothetical protein